MLPVDFYFVGQLDCHLPHRGKALDALVALLERLHFGNIANYVQRTCRFTFFVAQRSPGSCKDTVSAIE